MGQNKFQQLGLHEPIDLAARANFIEDLSSCGRSAYYVRFHQPVPPAEDKEPVSEFRLQSKQNKYVVDSILWTQHGIIYTAYGEINIVSLANVIYCRLVI